MIDPEKYIKDGLKVIDGLISNKNLVAALRACEELLTVNPYHKKAQGAYEKIKQLIQEENEKKVDADIQATMSLWKEERYEELLTIYSRLAVYAPDYRKLQKLIERARSKLSTSVQQQRESIISRAIEAIEVLFKEEKFSETVQASNELLAIDPLNAKAKKLLMHAKRRWVELLLNKQRHVLEGSDFEAALELCKSLLSIYPENQELLRMQKATQNHLNEQRHLAEHVHLNNKIENLKEFFAKSEFEHAVQASEEILQEDPHNVSATIFREKALQKLEAESEMIVLRRIREGIPLLQDAYKENPAGFLKV